MTRDDRPAIRFINYMSGREEMEARLIIGPYDTVEARDADLDRLSGLPLGAGRYHGGQQFFAAEMAEASDGWHDETVEPAQVADATTIRAFHAAFDGVPEDEEDDE
ncbi:hypothetical protein [Catenuloplanes japonicus]|uniref:hypothetical protein n=1 Tax=Catenuloplanes japonicus TaxID=33876 RepID=UPI000A690B15|nr:hypothetical protein [Catenuloplanes japonicus]